MSPAVRDALAARRWFRRELLCPCDISVPEGRHFVCGCAAGVLPFALSYARDYPTWAQRHCGLPSYLPDPPLPLP